MSDIARRLLTAGAIGVLVLALWGLGVFAGAGRMAVDLGFRLRTPPPEPSQVVVVGMDNASLQALGKLPWPRTHYARAVQRLSEAGARSIAFDMWFADAAASPAEDQALADAAQQAGNVFFALHMARSESTVKVTRSIRSLVGPSVSEAHVNVMPDPDGRLRGVSWEVHSLAERWLFMPVALAAAYRDVPPGSIERSDERLRIGSLNVPLEPNHNGQETFLLDPPITRLDESFLSFKDVVEGRFRADMVSGKIVIIGQVIQGGGYADVYDTVRGRKYGVVVLAETVQQLLDGRFLRRTPRWLTGAAVLAVTLLGIFLFRPRQAFWAWGAHVVLLLAAWACFLILLARFSVVIEPAPISAALLLSMAAGTLHSLRHASHELVRDERTMDILQQLGETVISVSGMPTLVTGRHPDVSDSFMLPARTPQVLLQTIAQAVGARSGGLYLRRNGGLAPVAVLETDRPDVTESVTADVTRRLCEDGPFAGALPSGGQLRTVLAMPLTFKGHVAGAVHLYDKYATEVSPGRRFTSADLRLVATMSQQAMIGLENASLYEGMRSIFLNATLALANAVDAKDPYTHGHSRRVLEYSELIARSMGLPERDIEITKMAAVLHDIGKIAIPDDILRKPGRLTDEEFAVIRTHPARGEGILAPLEELNPLRPAIRHHHERWDGGGYPDRLTGTDIPLCARIICVADSFDAITSSRYYRTARTPEVGLLEIERCGGTQFDVEIAACFVAAMRLRLTTPNELQAAASGG